ncbi:uncharacterized protein LOC131676292 [Topomyia yanbarensis]|uniref:uncharacterized protein LOC131676288 n=1 Tax=Topomyia yanbarensis TaxID=2498891 RepID=UPI00273A9913|nr:uncharacterized protein LOC131676288 [Topomyia yanbarensis]XP_058811395.1 uncharacterized protein LOC131676292 [Topomyia yanbarensis]
MRLFTVLILAAAALGTVTAQQPRSAVDVAVDIYNTCLNDVNLKCVKSKALSWLSKATEQDEIKITDTLTIIRTGVDEEETPEAEGEQRANKVAYLLNKIDSFLSTHALKMGVPEVLQSEEARAYIPNSLTKGGLAEELVVPLTDGNVAEGRGFVKKVMIPFLLGIKFKSTVLVPVALALIALKTWKAMTLGLLSMVLSAAMLIFKFAKPKIVNYEVVHYPPPHAHHVDHHIDHHHLSHPHVHWEAPAGWKKRSLDAQEQAYAGQL